MSRMALLLLVMLVPGVAADPGERQPRFRSRSTGARVLWSCWRTTPTRPGLAELVVEAGDATLEVPLRDDGVRPDAAVVTRCSRAASPRPRGAPGHLHLGRGCHGLWRDTAPLSGSQPTLRLVYGQGGTAAVFDTDAPGPSPTAAVAPAVAAARTDRSLAVVLGALGLAVGLWLGLTLAPGLTGPRRQG